MFTPFNSGLKFGADLAADSTQTILPIIIRDTGMCYGYYNIAETTFDGTETTFPLAEGDVPIQSVTMPPKVNDGRGYGVKQFMAAVFDKDIEGQKPWLGQTAWVDPNQTGYYTFWSLPTETWTRRFGRGVLLQSMMTRMDIVPSDTPDAPTPPDVSNGTMRWACTVNLASVEQECAFFDIPWLDTFQASLTADQQGRIKPLSISVVSNPPGGYFKATAVTGYGGQVPYPGGAVMFNTIRIMKLNDPVAGSYVFTFLVQNEDNLTTSVELTVTVV